MGSAVIFASKDIATAGQFGDVFGVVNASFSGLAFAGIIYTILLQRKELSLQRKELRLTRRELTRSAAAQENAEKALAQQVSTAQKSGWLATINFLIERYDIDIKDLRSYSDTSSDERRRHFEKRRARLSQLSDEMFDDVMRRAELYKNRDAAPEGAKWS